MSSPSSQLSATLPRGHACLPCRRRKLRCDGGKPVCNQCIRRSEQEDCEYSSEGPTRTQILERSVHMLESRIREIESPGEVVTLHPVPAAVGGSSINSAPLLPQGAYSSANQQGATMAAVPLTPNETYSLIQAFVPHATHLGFFLNIPRFKGHARRPYDLRDQYGQSLVATACLWGRRFARRVPSNASESNLLALAVHAVTNSFFLSEGTAVNQQAQAILGLIQAEVLLANYFFSVERFVEGKYHASAAVALAVSCKLNSVGSAGGRDPFTGGLVDSLTLLHTPSFDLASAPGDTVQIGERINAFWAVYILDKTWSVVTDTPASISDQGPVFAPWPLNMEAYEQGHVPPPVATCSIRTFLQAPIADPCTPLASHAKAATLLSRASNLAGSFYENMPNKDIFLSEFKALDTALITFSAGLPDISTLSLTPEWHGHLATCCLTHVAVIQLHSKVSRFRGESRNRCLAAAQTMVASVQSLKAETIGAVDPIVAMLLSIAGQYLIQHRASAAIVLSSSNQHSSLMATLNRVAEVMSGFGRVCPLMVARASDLLSNATF